MIPIHSVVLSCVSCHQLSTLESKVRLVFDDMFVQFLPE